MMPLLHLSRDLLQGLGALTAAQPGIDGKLQGFQLMFLALQQSQRGTHDFAG